MQIELRDHQEAIVAIDMNSEPAPGTIIETPIGEYRVTSAPRRVKQIDRGLGPRWVTIVRVERVDTKPVQASNPGRRQAVRG